MKCVLSDSSSESAQIVVPIKGQKKFGIPLYSIVCLLSSLPPPYQHHHRHVNCRHGRWPLDQKFRGCLRSHHQHETACTQSIAIWAADWPRWHGSYRAPGSLTPVSSSTPPRRMVSSIAIRLRPSTPSWALNSPCRGHAEVSCAPPLRVVSTANIPYIYISHVSCTGECRKVLIGFIDVHIRPTGREREAEDHL